MVMIIWSDAFGNHEWSVKHTFENQFLLMNSEPLEENPITRTVV